jgi:hypothetical protein
MAPRIRRIALTAHVTSSVGWLGSVVTYLALAVAALSTADAAFIRNAYPSLAWMAWSVIVPFCFGALLTGLVQSLGTEWGLVRHYWVLAKLAITAVSTAILLLHLPAITAVADLVASGADLGIGPKQLVLHAALATAALLTATALSIFKPWGRTGFAWDQPVPWGTLAAVGLVVALLGGIVAMHVAGFAPHH